jgi:hypothetical protein
MSAAPYGMQWPCFICHSYSAKCFGRSVIRMWDRISRQECSYWLTRDAPRQGWTWWVSWLPALLTDSCCWTSLSGNRFGVVTVTISYVYRGGKFGTRGKINVHCNVFEKEAYCMHQWGQFPVPCCKASYETCIKGLCFADAIPNTFVVMEINLESVLLTEGKPTCSRYSRNYWRDWVHLGSSATIWPIVLSRDGGRRCMWSSCWNGLQGKTK